MKCFAVTETKGEEDGGRRSKQKYGYVRVSYMCINSGYIVYNGVWVSYSYTVTGYRAPTECPGNVFLLCVRVSYFSSDRVWN